MKIAPQRPTLPLAYLPQGDRPSIPFPHQEGGREPDAASWRQIAAKPRGIGPDSPLYSQASVTRLEWLTYQLGRRWILVFGLVFGVFVGLPFLAPVFMKLGWETPARVIYVVYSLLCHQLPQRSYFLFGARLTYPLPEVQSAWKNTTDIMVLRQFIGNPVMGWKVAWSDRMVSMFTSIWLFSLAWWPLRRRIKALPWWGLVLFVLPMAVDGSSHLLSDLAGIGQGFRDSNVWLATLTSYSMPAGFYAGDAWGSFNSLMRLLTGALFGLGIVWYVFPYLDTIFSDEVRLAMERMNAS